MTEQELFEFVPAKGDESEVISAPMYSYWKSVGRKFFSSKLAIAMLVLLIALLLMSFFQPIFSGYTVINSGKIDDFSLRYNYPNFKNWFGTDSTGQSLFDAVWAGAKNSISISLLATLISTVIGVLVGAIWGLSKSIDKFMIEVYNVISNVPQVLILLVFAYAFGSGFWNLLFAMCVTSWISIAYTIRVQVIMYRDREYNIASRTLGTKPMTLINKNILPYLISVIVTIFSNQMPVFISLEVFLGFLGIGLPSDTPSLGRIIADYTDNITNHAYLFWIPVLILGMVTVSLYIVGQTLADASDPRTHQ